MPYIYSYLERADKKYINEHNETTLTYFKSSSAAS